MNRPLLTMIAISACLASSARAFAERLVVEEATLPKLVQDRNADVLASRLRTEAAERHTGHLLRSLLPTVRASGGSESFETGTLDRRTQPFGEVEATMSLYNGGRDRGRDAMVNLDRDAARADFELVLAERIGDVRTTLSVARFWRSVLDTLTVARTRNDAFLKLADRRIRGGLSTSTDRIEVEMNGAQLQQDVVRADVEHRKAFVTLASLLGESGADNIVISSVAAHQCGLDLAARPFDSAKHPLVRSATLSADREDRVSRQARMALLPSADLYGGYALYTARDREFDRREDRDDTFAGARLSMLLFDGRREAAVARGAVLRSEAARVEAEHRRRMLETDHERLKAEVLALDGAFHTSQAGLKKSDRFLRIVEDEYQRGVKNLPDLLAALSRTVELHRRHAETDRDHQTAIAHLREIIAD